MSDNSDPRWVTLGGIRFAVVPDDLAANGCRRCALAHANYVCSSIGGCSVVGIRTQLDRSADCFNDWHHYELAQ